MKNNNEKSKKQLLEELSKLRGRTKNLEKLKNTIIKIQEYLAASEEKFRSFVGFSSDGIALANENGKIIEWNISMTRITGLQPENVFGSLIWEIFFQIAEKEKAIIDSLLFPKYAGGIKELIICIKISINELDKDKLLKYALEINSKAVLRRLGFILESIGYNGKIINKIM